MVSVAGIWSNTTLFTEAKFKFFMQVHEENGLKLNTIIFLWISYLIDTGLVDLEIFDQIFSSTIRRIRRAIVLTPASVSASALHKMLKKNVQVFSKFNIFKTIKVLQLKLEILIHYYNLYHPVKAHTPGLLYFRVMGPCST